MVILYLSFYYLIIFNTQEENILQQLEKKAMNNLPCRIHPCQKITNFCTRQQCLVELCATCICNHTQMHNTSGTLPHYENIQKTFRRALQTIQAQRNVIGNESKRIVGFSQGWMVKRQSLYQTIRNAKKDVLELVETTFCQLQQKLNQTISEQQMKMGMKFGDRINKMLQSHKNQSDKLYNLQKQLAGPKGPETAKLLYSIVIPQSNSTLDKINHDFSILEAHDIRIEYFQDQLIGLKEKIGSLLAVQIKYPETVLRPPLVEFVETRPMRQVSTPMYKTASSFYSRPQSAGRPMGKSVVLLDGTPVVQHKPKISVISSQLNQGSRLLVKNCRRSNIFPGRPVSQLR